MEEILVLLAIGSLLCVAGVKGYDAGRESGHIQVASGQVVCQLETQKDKTQEWKCENAEGENE